MGIMKELARLNLIEELEKNEYPEKFATEIVEDLLDPQDPAYVCTTPAELSAALKEMSEESDA